MACKSFNVIHGSQKDTAPTKRQIIGHNAAYVSVCGDPS